MTAFSRTCPQGPPDPPPPASVLVHLTCPLPSLHHMEPNESRTSLQTGPDTGANWTEPRALSVLAAGWAPGWSPHCAGHPEPPRLLQGRGRVLLTGHFALPHIDGALASVLRG